MIRVCRSPVIFLVAPDQGALVARLGMTYAPSRTHDPGGGVTGLVASRDGVTHTKPRRCASSLAAEPVSA
jgi:hypothetical protein